MRGAIKLASNENPLGPSPRALAAAQAALAAGAPLPGRPHACARRSAAHHGVALDEVILGNGSERADRPGRAHVRRPGAKAVYPDPSFACYAAATIAKDMVAREVPLRDHVQYDVDAMRRRNARRARLFFLANPNNPTGAHLGGAALEQLLRALPASTRRRDRRGVRRVRRCPRLRHRASDCARFTSAPDRAAHVLQGVRAGRLSRRLRRSRRARWSATSSACVRRSTSAASRSRRREAALADQAHLARYVAHNGASARACAGAAGLGAGGRAEPDQLRARARVRAAGERWSSAVAARGDHASNAGTDRRLDPDHDRQRSRERPAARHHARAARTAGDLDAYVSAVCAVRVDVRR